MSGDKKDRVGRGRPPKHSQFKKGQSGNPRGRPRKPRRLPAPSQIGRDVLRVRELPVSIKTPEGEKILTLAEAVIYSIGKRALGDKVSFAKMWLALEHQALQEQVGKHRDLRLGELLQRIVDEKSPDRDQMAEEVLDALIKKWKKLL